MERLPVSLNTEADDAAVMDDLRRKIIALSTEVVSDAKGKGGEGGGVAVS